MPDLERAAERIARLTAGPHDLATLWHEATDVLAGAVPHFWAPCWYTLDPASLLMTSHVHDGMPEFPAEWLHAEYLGDDVHRLADVTRSATGISTLHEATGGDPSSSPRWHANMEMGGDQELILGLRTRGGEVWGALGLYRAPGAPVFDRAEKEFLTAVAPRLAEGARRALLVGEAVDPEGPEAPGLVVLDERLEVRSTTPAVDRWLAELPDGDPGAGRLPTAVLSVAARALRGGGTTAMARVLSRGGSWLVLHGAPLGPPADRQVAVIVEAAHPARILPLLMAAYGLTDRERDVTGLVLRGRSTDRIARELVVSAHTVQQHLKSVFDKTGVRTRRDLVATVFFTHYAPRFRDNEDRVVRGRPVRGGPVSAAAPPPPPAARSAPASGPARRPARPPTTAG
ncbi:LuxR C-terminal-related transcriptional regulator [Pseudonocardia broussonetiae]|uniref:LuxR C-terminal-related transcriptional regulator n=1 Tax=Pseudonocardia broussonetiae TaxID=2736640 RepID=UPI0019668A42|nr:LuxR C-terminal-related transcriptional regulator [Pseudonocardia broussonetiae]